MKINLEVPNQYAPTHGWVIGYKFLETVGELIENNCLYAVGEDEYASSPPLEAIEAVVLALVKMSEDVQINENQS